MNDQDRGAADLARGRKSKQEARSGDRMPYEKPRLTKKRALSRVTLYSSSGPDSTGADSLGG